MSKFRQLVLKETEKYFAMDPYYEYPQEMTNGDVLSKLYDIQQQLSQLHHKGEEEPLITSIIQHLEYQIKNKILSAHDIADDLTKRWIDIFTEPSVIEVLYDKEK